MEDRNWLIVDEWMREYGDKIIRVVYLIINDYHVAEEITQEVFIRAYKSMDNFRKASSPYTWLYRIALNLSKSYLRRKAIISFLSLKNELEEDTLKTESPEEKVVNMANSKMIRTCIKELPLIYREVIVLYYFQELKVSQIAQILRQPEGTVKSKLSRGRELLEIIMRKVGL